LAIIDGDKCDSDEVIMMIVNCQEYQIRLQF